MQIKFEKTIDYFLFFIILIKIIFVGSAVGHLILSHLHNDRAQRIDPKLVYWKERTEFIFIVSMAILLIYQFHPRLYKKPINQETSFWVLLFTAKWSIFIKEAPWYKTFSLALD
jgi:uncharacterized membrane protein YfcA